MGLIYVYFLPYTFSLFITKIFQGLSITLENVDRHVEGNYICSASNGIGEPTTASMIVQVNHSPEIVTEQVGYTVKSFW